MITKRKLMREIEELQLRMDDVEKQVERVEKDGTAVHVDYGIVTFRSFMKNFSEIFRAEYIKCFPGLSYGKKPKGRNEDA